VASRAPRLGLDGGALSFGRGRDLGEVGATAVAEGPHVLIVDSIHTLRDSGSESLAGGVGQVRACTDALVALAKDRGISVLLIGHVTKGGDLAGPRTLEHAVDAVLSFEGEPRSGLRILAATKNRFGPEGEVAWFEMQRAGLVEAEAGPRWGQGESEPGCATALTLAGRRAFALDVQALVVERQGRITGYSSILGFFGHSVGETNLDLQALIASAESFAGPGILVPIRNAALFRWCLEQGLRVTQPMTLMSMGLYNEPEGAFLPSIGC